jgi:putative sigma-54 modulation protein
MVSRYEAKKNRINVSLFDVNGPKGGEDKCCKVIIKIIIKINGSSSIVVQEITEDLYHAINTCSRRVRRAVKRQISVHVRNRREINDVLLLTKKDDDVENGTI